MVGPIIVTDSARGSLSQVKPGRGSARTIAAVDYGWWKVVHQVTVALSIAGFFGRGIGALTGAAWVRGRIARTLPHVVDTALLVSALAMVWLVRMPLTTPWLLAKIAGLLVYIALGTVALRPGRPWGLRAAAWAGALATFAYIVSVALTKNPAGFLATL
jgi:uncharacterized membrane protein SirB2